MHLDNDYCAKLKARYETLIASGFDISKKVEFSAQEAAEAVGPSLLELLVTLELTPFPGLRRQRCKRLF